MKKLRNTLVATVAVAAGLLAPAGSSSASTTAWNDGFHDEDTIINCATRTPATGVHANVSWSSPAGRVPRIGEKFYLRGYIGLVGLPCSSGVLVMPEILVPRGIEFVDEDVRWDLTKAGQPQVLEAAPLVIDPAGSNGGILLGPAPEEAFKLERGDVLEFQFPVKATREMIGPGSQQPTCQTRRDGVAPCPVSQSGDHFQVAFTVGGHGGNKRYVTPYVGLFATNATTTPTPTTPTTPGTPTPTTPTNPGIGKATSSTKATWKASASRRGKVTVVVSSARAVTGSVVVKDKGRTIARAVLKAKHRGRIVITLPKLRRGKHVLTAQYAGSPTVAASTSARRAVSLR